MKFFNCLHITNRHIIKFHCGGKVPKSISTEAWICKCKICSKEFPSKQNLDKHLTEFHAIIKLHDCDSCSIYFPINELNKHKLACINSLKNEQKSLKNEQNRNTGVCISQKELR